MKKRADGRYVETIVLSDGKRKFIYGKTIAEVKRKMMNFKESEEVKNDPTFSELVEEWRKVHYPTIREITQVGYDSYIKLYIEPAIGGKRLSEITPKSIVVLLSDLSRQKYSTKTISSIRSLLSVILKYAVVEEYIQSSPMPYVSEVKGKPKKIKEALTDEEINIIKNNTDTIFGLMYFLILYTGCRKGEALALQWSDIDFNKKVISITKTCITKLDSRITEPKTQNSIRTIPLLMPLENALKTHINTLKRHDADDYIFYKDNPKAPLTNAQFLSMQYFYRTKTGLKIYPHKLRHTYATILFELGINTKDAQTMLGHAYASTTEDIYTHIRESHKEQVFDKIRQKFE